MNAKEILTKNMKGKEMETNEVIEKLKIAIESCRTSLCNCADILESVPQNPLSGTNERTYLHSAVSFLQRAYGFLDNIGAKLSMQLRDEQINETEMEKKMQEERRVFNIEVKDGKVRKVRNEPKMPKRVRKHSEKKVKHASKI
jgi:hypothetical protein